MGHFKQKSAFKQTQNVQINIILHMRSESLILAFVLH